MGIVYVCVYVYMGIYMYIILYMFAYIHIHSYIMSKNKHFPRWFSWLLIFMTQVYITFLYFVNQSQNELQKSSCCNQITQSVPDKTKS